MADRPSNKPRGKAVRWDAADLDRLSEVTPADVKAADELWRQAAPFPLKLLLEAKPY